MKIKTDFVTNSSSTSFVAIGVRLEISDLEQNKQSIYEAVMEHYKSKGRLEWAPKSFQAFEADLRDYTYTWVESVGLEMDSPPYDDAIYIGMKPQGMKDTETLLEFKQRIRDMLNQLMLNITDDQIGWIENCRMDG